MLSERVTYGNPTEPSKTQVVADAAVHSQENAPIPSDRNTVLAVEGLHKVYGREVHALRGIDLKISDGEFVTLLGPSGSGKSTLLMAVAGFEMPSHGRILSGGVDITAVPPQRRNFGVVFQSYALFPHLTVRKNIAYPLAARGMPKKQQQNLVDEVLSVVGLEGLGDRRPAQLSGGQQQRVAIARALVYQPSILILDEPLGALDRALRERMKLELRNLHRKLGVTIIYVTHDQDEALTLSDRVVVMRDGCIEQIGTPEEVYARPATEFVATFVGKANLLRKPDSEEIMVIRPEKVRLKGSESTDNPDEMELSGKLEEEVFVGSLWRYFVSTPAGRIEIESAERARAKVGDSVRLCWRPEDGWVVPRNSRRSTQLNSRDSNTPERTPEDFQAYVF